MDIINSFNGWTIPTISQIFGTAIDILVYILSIMGAISIVLIGILFAVCVVITIINIVISATSKLCKRIRHGKRNI